MKPNPDAPEPIDLRSDVVTTPTAAMWRAMQEARLGWASAGEDDSVNELEDVAARLTGKEAGLFVLTGTMANLAALLTHGARGDQILVEVSSHILWCEEWHFSYFCGLASRSLQGTRGRIEPDAITNAIQESKYRHRPRTALLCLENTDNVYGAVLAPASIAEMAAAAHSLDVPVHLDGARVLNACVAAKVTLADMLEGVDSAMISLNKGLSAPGGALLVGTSEFVASCRRHLRRLGGGSHHQGGIYAAAALVALDSMMDQLDDDNRRARSLATLLAPLPGLHVDPAGVDSNIVMVELADEAGTAESFQAALAASGVRAHMFGPQAVRFVTHRHIDDLDVARAAEAVRSALG